MSPVVTLRRGDACGKIETGHGGDRPGLLDQFSRVLFDSGQDAAHHAAAAQMAHQRARIEIGDDGDTGIREERAGFLIRAPVAGDGGELAHSKALDVRLPGFVIRGAGAVITDLRVGENDNLPGIGGIGEDFLVPGNSGIEDNFAGTFGGRTKTPAFEDRAVFQGEDCRIQVTLVPSWEWVTSSLPGDPVGDMPRASAVSPLLLPLDPSAQ